MSSISYCPSSRLAAAGRSSLGSALSHIGDHAIRSCRYGESGTKMVGQCGSQWRGAPSRGRSIERPTMVDQAS